MIRAFELAIGQLGDPRLRSLIWWSLLLSLVLQVAIAALGIWGLRSLATFETRWINETIVWLSGTGVIETPGGALKPDEWPWLLSSLRSIHQVMSFACTPNSCCSTPRVHIAAVC